MRVMMTGGTGFAGSHTVRRYIEAGHQVRLLVRDREKVQSRACVLRITGVGLAAWSLTGIGDG